MKLLVLLALLLTCAAVQAETLAPVYQQMTGTYMSPGDKNTATKLSLHGDLFEYEFYTDAYSSDEVSETRKFGQYLVTDNKVYVPVVKLYRHKEGSEVKFVTSSSITFWHIDKLKNTTVLIRDDEYGAWKKSHKTPSPSAILIKVSAEPNQFDHALPNLKSLGAPAKPLTKAAVTPVKKEAAKPAAEPAKKEPAKPAAKATAKPAKIEPAKPVAKEAAKPSSKQKPAAGSSKTETAKPAK